MAQSAKANLARNALTMTLLMFMSVIVGIVAAEVPNGNGTTGINKNDTVTEHDGASIIRTPDNQIVQSKDQININNGMMMTAAGDTTTGSNSYAMATSTWVGVADIGPVSFLDDGAGLDTTVDDLLASITTNSACTAGTYSTTLTAAMASLGGSGAVVDFTCNVGNSAISIVTVTTSGTGYTAGEVITIPIGTIHASQATAVVITLVADDLLTAVRTNNQHVTATSIGGTGGGVTVAVTNAADGQGGESVTMTLQNWYGSIDRSSPHGLGASVKAAGLQGCVDPVALAGNPVMTCTLNHPENGIAVELPTQILMYPNEGSNTFSYGITATSTAAAMFYGVDYTVGHNVSVYINGVKEATGNTRAVDLTDDVVLKCSDTACTQSDVELGIPGAFNKSGISKLGGSGVDEYYNVTSRLSVYDGTTVKLTFGIATEHQANITATHGSFFDPSIRFLADEPGVRIGQIENGGASWCDAWWFLAKCGDMLSFDGLGSDGMDGVMLHYKVPLEAMYSQAAWGGYDLVQLRFSHSYAKQCFNGEIQTYVVAPSDMGDFRTKNSMLKYATSGDYYTMTEPTSTHSSGTSRLGTSTADYCFGDTTSQPETLVDIGRIGQMTSSSPYAEYLNGFYDYDSQMYEFYVIVSIEQSSTPASSGVTNEFAFDTGAGTAADDGDAPGITLENVVARNPLEDFAPNEYRSTNSTNQSNPAFASTYVMYYSGITPSDNVIAGRNLTDDDWGHRWQGLQHDPLVRKPTGVDVYTATYTGAGYEAINNATITTPLSTIECGAAAFGGSMVSATIDIFTSTDTSLYYGAGQNGSGYPTEPIWKAYGTLSTNSSRWLQDAATGNNGWDVDNTEANTGSSVVTFTGSFINTDNYKATCTFVYHSDDITAGNVTTTTLVHDYYFTAAHDGAYTTGGGSDVTTDDDDDGILDDLGAYDYVIIGIALTLIGLAIYMWSSGSGITSWFDDRLAMMMLGGAIMTAWVAQTYGSEGTGDIGSDAALAIGTLAYLVMALAAYFWGNASSKQGERNFRFALGGLFLIVIGVPTALTGLMNVESDFLVDAMWNFPVYDAIAGLGAFVGIILLGSAAAGLYRRDGM